MNLEWSGPLNADEQAHLDTIRAGVDRDRLAAIMRRHRHTWFGRHKRKHLRLLDFLGVVFEDVVRLDLHRSPPLRILDIGTGPGAMAHVMTHFGHAVIATEREDDESRAWVRWRAGPEEGGDGTGRQAAPNSSLYADLAALLGVHPVIWTVEAHTPAPDLGGSFDLVCARSFYFDHPRGQPMWGLAPWRFFIADVERVLLRAGGRLFLGFAGDLEERRTLLDALAHAGTSESGGRVVMDREACRRFVAES